MPKLYKLSDYKVPDFLVQHVDLEIDLTKHPIQSKASLRILFNTNSVAHPVDLVLDGENMKLTAILLDGDPLSVADYELSEHSLLVKNVPQDRTFTLETTTLLGENTDLFGLYETEGTILVKAETEGLRRVLYCNDRPDNLATYNTTIIANQTDYPILLSNGVLIESKELPDGTHFATWSDNVPKPSYLFALVAGKLQYSFTHFKTKSGRDLPIEFYVPPAATVKCDFAKEVLKSAMKWDEDTYKLECELPQHMVAGVDKYASGASEPTGLNLFNTENLYATPETKTDFGMLRVLEVVAHEFFHYWSGDRVTIRDWFNLPFKEGLTTFRAAMFREDLFGTDLIRLLDGKNLDERAPRQDSYTAVRSLYTAAAYEKSADIFRMMMLTLGKKTFYKAMTKFLKMNDGGVVTLENMLDSLSATTGTKLQLFMPWFTESGIPSISAKDEYNSETKRYTLKLITTNGKSRPIPFVFGLLNSKGKEILVEQTLLVDKPEMEFNFDNIADCPTPSLLRSFSAPVYLHYEYSTDDLLLLMQYDTNLYNRCEAAKNLIKKMVAAYSSGDKIELTSKFFSAYRSIITEQSLGQWMKAEILTLPSEEELIAGLIQPDFEKIAAARQLILSMLSKELAPDLHHLFNQLQTQSETNTPQFTHFDINDAGKRRLIQVCFSYLQYCEPENTKKYLDLLFKDSLGKNMTDTTNALNLLCGMNCSEAEDALNEFYDYWKQDTNAINYWFTTQAAAHSSTVVDKVKKLLNHPDFDLTNPNKVYALLGAFVKNPYGFHTISGEGYLLIAEVVNKLDKINPALAARLTENFISWDKYDTKRQQMMLNSLVLINDNAVSVDVKNTAKKGLDKAKGSSPLPIQIMFITTNTLGNKNKEPSTTSVPFYPSKT